MKSDRLGHLSWLYQLRTKMMPQQNIHYLITLIITLLQDSKQVIIYISTFVFIFVLGFLVLLVGEPQIQVFNEKKYPNRLILNLSKSSKNRMQSYSYLGGGESHQNREIHIIFLISCQKSMFFKIFAKRFFFKSNIFIGKSLNLK